MGYVRGVVHGMIIGGVAALLYAPKPGRQMREDLSERFDQMRGQMQPVIDQAQGVVEAARPQVERGISKAQQQAQRVTKRGNGSSTTSINTGANYGGSSAVETGSAPSPSI